MLRDEVHLNNRQALANQLNIPLERFDTLLRSANRAYEFLRIMGPFYGQEEIHEPTFRVTAEPVRMPIGSKKLLTNLGEDLLYLGRVLPLLPHVYKAMIGGNELDFRVPLTFRVDCIIDKNGAIKVNEIEGKDGASALMMIEQLAYSLQPFQETTIGRFIATLHSIFGASTLEDPLRIAIVRCDVETDLYALNTFRFIEMVHELSKGEVRCDLYDMVDIKSKKITPDWALYFAIFNETNHSPEELKDVGIPIERLFAAGNYDALVNKGVFALVHEPALKKFWEDKIGVERLLRLKELLIPSRFITTDEELDEARKEGKVAKVTWAEGNMMIANRSKGVAMPVGDIMQSAGARWDLLHECLKLDYTIIAQDYVEPAKISSFLRKKGTTLEPVDWYNRVCVKYVVDGNPNTELVPSVSLTAVEVTLGPNVVPASRECAFTAGAFVEKV